AGERPRAARRDPSVHGAPPWRPRMSSERPSQRTATTGDGRLDREALRRALQNVADARAEQERRAEQLRRFVEGAPALVSARELQDLADATSTLAASLFAADETFVSLQHGGTEVMAHHGDAHSTSSLASWLADPDGAMPPSSGARVSTHPSLDP